MTTKLTFQPSSLPMPSGAYSQSVRVGDSVFVAGMVGVDADRRLAGDDITSQTRQALRNMEACLEAAGASLGDVCQVTTFLEHADRDFEAYDAAYREFFPTDPPARATVESHIVGEPIIEMQAIAVVGRL